MEVKYNIDFKGTVWERFTIFADKSKEQEIIDNYNNIDFFYNKEEYDINNELLEEVFEYLPIEENRGNSTVEIINMNTGDAIWTDEKLIDKEDIKMFSINDLEKYWEKCYDNSLKEDYPGFIDTLKLSI